MLPSAKVTGPLSDIITSCPCRDDCTADHHATGATASIRNIAPAVTAGRGPAPARVRHTSHSARPGITPTKTSRVSARTAAATPASAAHAAIRYAPRAVAALLARAMVISSSAATSTSYCTVPT